MLDYVGNLSRVSNIVLYSFQRYYNAAITSRWLSPECATFGGVSLGKLGELPLVR